MAEEAKKKSDAPAAGQSDKPAAEKKDAGKGGGAASVASAAGATAAKGGLLTKTPVLLGGVMVLEAALLLAGFKILGGSPKSVSGAELTAADETASATSADSSDKNSSSSEHGGGSGKESSGGGNGEHGATATSSAAPTKIDKKKSVEVEVLGSDFKPTNKVSGKTYLYDVTIVAVTRAEYEERVKNAIKDRKHLISDRVRTIIATLDPEKLGEPGLETLRRQVNYQLNLIVGDGLIDEILVPRCFPIRVDY